ncbi:MAG: type I polyketide synthase, partial [Myxococcota bacterium]
LGHLDSLGPAPLTRRAPGPGEVEVRIRATGLNFRDLLQALGSLGRGYAGTLSLDHIPFGFECSGVIARVGAGVSDFAVGTPVMAAFTPGGLASHVTLPARFVVAKPDALSWADAAALPTAWLTVWHALDDIAAMSAGEYILIHAAAGGVGSAAVRHALTRGAEVIATAHPSKWPYLRQLGVTRMASSRDASFADRVLEWTDGRGVDIVLNSLAGHLAQRSVEITAPGGRFVDLARLSGLDREQVQSMRDDITYHYFDLGLLAAAGDETVTRLLGRLREASTEPAIQLATRAYPIAEAERAFRAMQAGRHMGKLALTQPHLHIAEAVTIQPDATYLITGGTGGLGLRVAEWLAAKGATHLGLLARREPAEAARATIARLRQRGVTVRNLAADVCERTALDRALAELRSDGRPLRGIIHAAGALDDALVTKLDRQRLRTALDPKVRGTCNLDALTRNDPLDLFVLFSSSSALLGSPGQANYAAANAFLDAFAWHRRANGRPAISLAYGAWAEIGAAARKQSIKWMRTVGVDEISPAQGIDALAAAVTEGPVHRGVMAIDWSRFGHHASAERRYFARMVRDAGDGGDMAAAQILDLRGLDSKARHEALDEYLRGQIAVVLGLDSGDEVSPRSRLMDLGMDSLMAVELKSRLERTLGLTLRATLMYDYPTVEALIGHLSDELGDSAATSPADRPEPASEELAPSAPAIALDGLDELGQLSDHEVLKRLRR